MKWIFVFFAGFWTILVILLVEVNYRHAHSTSVQMVNASARDMYIRDSVYRRWAAAQGGFYVPITPEMPPNPYLEHIPDRDFTTPSGKMLTLVNPAYMTRQVHEMGQKEYGLRVKITSLNPLRPENEPDEWEAKALSDLEEGAPEVFSLDTQNNEPHYRFMKPMVAEEGCLKCHAEQGFVLGDVHGGISVSVPWEPFRNSLRALQRTDLFAYGAIWAFGFLGLVIARQRIHLHLSERRQAEDSLRASLKEKEMLLREVHHRVKNNLAVVSALLNMQRQTVEDPVGAAALKDLDGRIKTIALVHERLYRKGNLAEIDFQDYLDSLLREIHASIGLNDDIRCVAKAHGIILGIDVAVPCGMIVNELVTNAFKHAFRDQTFRGDSRTKEISVSMQEDDKGCVLVIADNGMGMPGEIDLQSTGSYGLRIARMIATHQLRGSIDLDRSNGARFVITFDFSQKEA
ncbi:histidine kinase dimerization/phosphoacceptor domain -containing protein [Desulfonatronum parangueonense]